MSPVPCVGFSVKYDGIVVVVLRRMFLCIQTLNKSYTDEVGDVVLVTPNNRIIGCGHSMFAFDYDSLAQPELADDTSGTMPHLFI